MSALVPLCALQGSVMRSSQSSGSRAAEDECQDHSRNPWICEKALKSWGIVTGGRFLENIPQMLPELPARIDLNLSRNVYQKLKRYTQFYQEHNWEGFSIKIYIGAPKGRANAEASLLDFHLGQHYFWCLFSREFSLPANKWSLFHPVLAS